MSGFYAKGENFDRLFMTQHQFADRFLGNQLYTWGQNGEGQLGTNTTVNRSSPGDIVTAAKSNNWVIISGASSSAGIKSDGTLWCWGSNIYSTIGDNSTTNKSSPVTVAGGGSWSKIYVQTTAVGIKTDGSLWTWTSSANQGQLGNNTLIGVSSPVTVAGGGNNWISGAAGPACNAGIKSNGSLWTWGQNTKGSLGLGDTNDRSSPTQVFNYYDWSLISFSKHDQASSAFAAAIKTNGTLWTWGDNSFGKLGSNNTVSRSSPGTTSGGGTNWKTVTCGIATLAAIKTDGTLWMCGFGGSGALGDNSTLNRSSPVTIAGGGTTWKTVSPAATTAAIKTDGTLWTWGDGYGGVIGNNTTISRSSPVQIATGITQWRTVILPYGDTLVQYYALALSEG